MPDIGAKAEFGEIAAIHQRMASTLRERDKRPAPEFSFALSAYFNAALRLRCNNASAPKPANIMPQVSGSGIALTVAAASKGTH